MAECSCGVDEETASGLLVFDRVQVRVGRGIARPAAKFEFRMVVVRDR